MGQDHQIASNPSLAQHLDSARSQIQTGGAADGQPPLVVVTADSFASVL